jgi:hypothetical protein
MNWEIEYMQEEGVLYIRTSGSLSDVRENQMMIADGLAEGAKHGATKFLIDDRDLTLKLGTMDIYSLPETFKTLGVSHEYKVAIVFATVSKEDDDFKFYETRASNLGYKHRLFTDLKAALDWLTERAA